MTAKKKNEIIAKGKQSKSKKNKPKEEDNPSSTSVNLCKQAVSFATIYSNIACSRLPTVTTMGICYDIVNKSQRSLNKCCKKGALNCAKHLYSKIDYYMWWDVGTSLDEMEDYYDIHRRAIKRQNEINRRNKTPNRYNITEHYIPDHKISEHHIYVESAFNNASLFK